MAHYNLMVENAPKIIGSLAKDPEGLSGSFLSNGLISQGTFDEINELSVTKKGKGRVLYRAIISVVNNFPERFNDFIRTLEEDKTTHRDLLIHLTGNTKKGISIVETDSPGSKGYKDSGTQVSRKTFEGWPRKKVLDSVDNKTILGEDDLSDVLQALEVVSADWREICTKLHVKSNTIRSLASSNKTPYVCLTEGLTEWLQRNYYYQQHGKPTWRKVASSVANLNTVLFLKVAEEHLKEGVEIYDTQEIEEEEGVEIDEASEIEEKEDMDVKRANRSRFVKIMFVFGVSIVVLIFAIVMNRSGFKSAPSDLLDPPTHKDTLPPLEDRTNSQVISASGTEFRTRSKPVKTPGPRSHTWVQDGTLIKPDDKPKMPELRRLKLQNGDSIDLVVMIGTSYPEFGVHILRDKNYVDIIEQGCYYKPKCIVEEILGDWLKGKGRRPVIWTTFVECLRESKLEEVAMDVERQFIS